MVENGVQLTLTSSTVKNTGSKRINGKGINGLHTKEKHERNGNNNAHHSSKKSQEEEQHLCTTCAKGHTCQSVISRTRQMRALIDAKKPYQAHSVFKHLVDEGHKPSLVTYTTLLTALTNARTFEAIPSLLAQLELAGLRADSIFFNALINAFVEAGRMGEAMNTFWKMKHSGCSPTTSTFNTLIKGYGIAGKPEEAQRLFDMMLVGAEGEGGSSARAKPNLTSYNILVKAWCDGGKLEEAWSVVVRMRAGGMEPDIVTYNTIASAYANNDETWRAEELVVEVGTRVRTSERTWGIIVGGYCREGRLEEALRCVQRMKDAGVLPNVVIFNTLLKGFLDANDMDAVDNILGLMEQSGIKPDIVTYSHQLNALSSLGHMSQCMEVFDRMVEAGVEPDPQVYSILAKGYVRAQQPAKAEELLTQMMSGGGVRPNVVTFTTVISGWCSAADMASAMRVYKKMREAGVSPNVRTFETLIWGYSELKQPWKAEEVLRLMREAGVRPRQTTYGLVADAWKAVGVTTTAEESSSQRANTGSSDHLVDHNSLQRSEDGDDNKLQSFNNSNGQATGNQQRSSFLQVTNALGSRSRSRSIGGGVFGRSLKVPAAKTLLRLVKTTSSPLPQFLQKTKHGGLYSKGIIS